MSPEAITVVTWIIFGLTYLGLALGKLPGLRTDRAGIALAGAAAVLAFGVLPRSEAAAAVDYETILLLFGMMVVVGYLRASGFFALVTERVIDHCSSPWLLLAAVVALSGGLSAFLVNDVVCVALTPLVLHLCRRLRRPPLPYLIALATASNVGSAATITGNPQNIIIGSLSHIPYLRFAARLAPVALAGLVLTFVVVAVVYRKTLSKAAELPVPSDDGEESPRVVWPLLYKSSGVTLAAVGLFFAGLPTATVALGGAAVLLLDRLKPERAYRSVDWPLLVMFVGLFVVVRAFQVHVVAGWGVESWEAIRNSPVVLVSGLSLGLSNLVSNVPAVLLMEPLAKASSDPETAWLALAMSSTLAGNLTLLGSVANLIVAETARRAGQEVGFVEYLRVGVPLTLLTTLAGVGWLALVRY